jgi:hypothetical protein
MVDGYEIRPRGASGGGAGTYIVRRARAAAVVEERADPADPAAGPLPVTDGSVSVLDEESGPCRCCEGRSAVRRPTYGAGDPEVAAAVAGARSFYLRAGGGLLFVDRSGAAFRVEGDGTARVRAGRALDLAGVEPGPRRAGRPRKAKPRKRAGRPRE